MTHRNTLIVFAKEPRLGRVKTRLGREIGDVEALRVYRVLLADVLRRLGRDPRWQTVVAVAPDSAVDEPVWPSGIAIVPQGGGDLGARMQRAFDRIGQGPAIIIGSDIPGITPSVIARGFSLLGSHDAVFGPARDGGYWLVGAKRFPRLPQLFDNVRWSSVHTLDDTLKNAEGLKVAMLDALEDVDDAASYRRWLTQQHS